jgi:hypothetical protein
MMEKHNSRTSFWARKWTNHALIIALKIIIDRLQNQIFRWHPLRWFQEGRSERGVVDVGVAFRITGWFGHKRRYEDDLELPTGITFVLFGRFQSPEN